MGHQSDDLRMGPVFAPNPDYLNDGNPAPMELGIGPMGRCYVFDAVPVASGPALLGTFANSAAGTPLALTAGAGVQTKYNDGNRTTAFVLDYARQVTLTSAGNAGAVGYLVQGLDIYGMPMSQLVSPGPNANTVKTSKAFKTIISITPQGTTGVPITVGFNDSLGMPVRVTDAGYIADPKWAGALAADNGTFVPADVTTPATPLTGDVRGIYTPSSAANGVRRLVIGLFLTGIQVGPQATRVGAVGVNQA